MTKKFPKEETYSLTDQLRRASRSIVANIVEGWSKRRHINIFKRHLLDSIGSCDETRLWIKIAHDCKYITDDEYRGQDANYEEIGKMLASLLDRWHPLTDRPPAK